VLADGARLPFRDSVADLLCFAQAWHWLDEDRRCKEAARVLRAGGRWAGWWSHARADGAPWFDAYWDELEASLPGVHRGQRDTDWGAGLAASGHFNVSERITVPWERSISVDHWLTDQRSHSYIADLAEPDREAVMGRLAAIVHDGFPDGAMAIRYETWLWIADRRPVSAPVPVLRRAELDDAPEVADVWLRSRHASIPAIPPPVHTDDEVRGWFATIVLPEREVWVLDADGEGIVGLLVLEDGWVDQLYLAPGRTGQGFGSRLLGVAKERNPSGLELWTFQSNVGARRFYERHGFVVVASTDGNNEEGAPDVHYRWRAP